MIYKDPPEAFLSLLKEQEEERIKRDKLNEFKRNSEDIKEDNLIKTLRTALYPYNNTIINNQIITVQEHDKDTYLFIDGFKWMTFRPKWHWYSCSCEAPCDHESSRTLTLASIEHRPKLGDFFIYASWDLQNPKSVALEMQNFIKDYNWYYAEK